MVKRALEWRLSCCDYVSRRLNSVRKQGNERTIVQVSTQISSLYPSFQHLVKVIDVNLWTIRIRDISSNSCDPTHTLPDSLRIVFLTQSDVKIPSVHTMLESGYSSFRKASHRHQAISLCRNDTERCYQLQKSTFSFGRSWVTGNPYLNLQKLWPFLKIFFSNFFQIYKPALPKNVLWSNAMMLLSQHFTVTDQWMRERCWLKSQSVHFSSGRFTGKLHGLFFVNGQGFVLQ